jgi:4'-phosphopantetheinyl transferase
MGYVKHGGPWGRIQGKPDPRQRRAGAKARPSGSQISVPRVLHSVDPALFCGPKGALRIAPHSVHVWSFFLNASSACRDECALTLSGAEQARAERFIHERSRDNFIVAHGVLRQLLARYTGVPASRLAFSSGPNGKPTIAFTGVAVSFNMTHSHGRALIAVSDEREVGIDLEQLNPAVKALAIARRYFCPAELAAIETGSPTLQAENFFRYWVAKEAVLKGEGIGLKFPIDKFEIEFDASGATAVAHALEDSRLARDWRIRMLRLDGDWIGAVALRGDNWHVIVQSLCAPRVPVAKVP